MKNFLHLIPTINADTTAEQRAREIALAIHKGATDVVMSNQGFSIKTGAGVSAFMFDNNGFHVDLPLWVKLSLGRHCRILEAEREAEALRKKADELLVTAILYGMGVEPDSTEGLTARSGETKFELDDERTDVISIETFVDGVRHTVMDYDFKQQNQLARNIIGAATKHRNSEKREPLKTVSVQIVPSSDNIEILSLIKNLYPSEFSKIEKGFTDVDTFLSWLKFNNAKVYRDHFVKFERDDKIWVKWAARAHIMRILKVTFPFYHKRIVDKVTSYGSALDEIKRTNYYVYMDKIHHLVNATTPDGMEEYIKDLRQLSRADAKVFQDVLSGELSMQQAKAKSTAFIG